MARMKNAERLSSRKWKGSPGSPIGRTTASAGACNPASAIPASASARAPPAGKRTRATNQNRRSAKRPATPSTSHPATTARIASTPRLLTGQLPCPPRCSALAARAQQPRRQLAAGGVLDDPLPDQLPHHLRGRDVVEGADLLEDLLLARIDEQRQPRSAVFHGNGDVNAISIK